MLISLTMIVRDEEDLLGDCLLSVRDAVDEIVVVDTGSRDASIEVAQGFGARVLEAEWRGDFAAARNVALAAARGDWVLVMDADERFEGDPRRLRTYLARTRNVGLEVPIRNEIGGGRVDMHSALRLFRRLPGVQFERRLHEQVLPSLLAAARGRKIGKAPFALRHLGYSAELVARKGKHERNLALAQAECTAYPFDPFAAFNLGVEHAAGGELSAAVEEFRRARSLAPGPQPWQSRLYKMEVQSLYRLGRYEEAMDLLREALPGFPEFTDLYLLQGVTLDALGDAAGAEDALRHCLRLGPAKSPPYDGVDPLLGGAGAKTALGSLLRRQFRSEVAIPLLREAAVEAPFFLPAVQELVECVLDSGGTVGDLADEGVADPLAVGAALFRKGRYDLALRAFAAAEEERSDLPPDHYLTKAIAHLRLGDLQEADQDVAAAGAGAERSARAYVVDLVRFAQGRLPRERLEERYAPQHAIWRDIPPIGSAVGP